MRKFILVGVLALSGVITAHAQDPVQVRHPPYTNPGRDTLHDALRDPDPIHRDERLIAGANKRINGNESISNARIPTYSYSAPTFEARVVVANKSNKRIKAVSWTALLTEPGTGQLIGAFDVTTKARIAPGRTRELKKRLPTPQARLVSATTLRRNPRQVADLKVAVKSVTYEDGTTSTTP